MLPPRARGTVTFVAPPGNYSVDVSKASHSSGYPLSENMYLTATRGSVKKITTVKMSG